MALARAAHTATPLPDGKVLIAGGCTSAGCGGTPEGGRSEIFDPLTRRFESGPQMVRARAGHTATKLNDGRILFAGGYPDEGRPPLAEAELFDPATCKFTETGTLTQGRGAHTATVLRDGRILLVGGVSGRAALSTVEAYDPASGRFSEVPPMPSPRTTHGAVLLGSGLVLIVGGQSLPGHGNALLNSTLLYDPAANSWRPAGLLKQFKYKLAVAPLPNGGALVIGGQTADDAGARLRETEIFQPATANFTAGPEMAEPRYKISDAVAVLPDGRLVIAGNIGIEVYSGGAFTRLQVPADAPERQFPAVAALPSGRVLVTGGYSERTQPTASAVVAAI